MSLQALPQVAEICIFADSLYRLSVNGIICGYGPARFVPSHPEYDRHEISKILQIGENLVRMEVNAVGAPTYQAVASIGGVTVRGHIDGLVSLDMGEGWLVRRSGAWDSDSEHYSFAQGPVEICDTRVLEREDYDFAPPVRVQGGVWGQPLERAVPGPSLLVREPVRIVTAAALKSDVFRVGFRCPIEEGGRQPFFTHIFSPCEQTIKAGAFWGPIGIHGKWMQHTLCKSRGNRESVQIQLNAGWNFIFGIPAILKASWAWQMELPTDRGLLVRALPETENPAAFCLGPILAESEIPELPPQCADNLPGHPSAWHPPHGPGRPPSPARELAWDLPEKSLLPPGAAWILPIELPAGADTTMVLDFEDEYLGHAFVEVDAAAGTILDIGHDERLRNDDLPDYYRCNPFLNSADRFVLRGGRQHVETFHEHGGRYLQLTFREVSGPVRIHAAGVRSGCGEYPRTGAFSCGDEDLDWAWEAADRTLRASMADGWIDPWRERGLYIGDALVQGHATRKITSDWRIDPWCLRLWARAQFADGQLPDVVPSHPHRPLCDYTLIWIIALRNYWAASGDTELVRELWPTIPKIFASPVWKAAEGGLWEITAEMKIFVDWGVVPQEREGINAALNAFRFRALECASEMATALGMEQEAEFYQREATDVRTAFRDLFLDHQLERFAAAKLQDGLFQGPALHANALALAFGICDEKEQTSVADYVAGGLNISEGFPVGRCELYFLYYALDGLYCAGRVASAENAMREYYGFMRRRGARTLWETLEAGARGNDSMCHGWSSGAVPYLSERLLGVRPARPGDPSRMIIAPESETLSRAEGIVPHPAGPIAVAWRIEGTKLMLTVEAPAGVEIEMKPQGRLTALDIVQIPSSDFTEKTLG